MNICNTLQPLGVKTAVAIGYFDGFHLGHKAVLEVTLQEARRYSLQSTLLTFDMSGRRASGKGGKSLFGAARREKWAEEMGFKQYVSLPFGDICELSEKEFVQKVLGHGCLNAAVVLCGEDFRFGKGRSGDIKSLEKLCGPYGIRVIPVKSVIVQGAPVSTTRIKKLVEAGDLSAAAKLLGRSYDIEGEVIHGNHLGRDFGFATVNIALDPTAVMPKKGVYISETVLPDGERLRSVTNIGTRPTVTEDEQPISETHIIDFYGNLYGETVSVKLLRFIRPEQRFESTEQLKETVKQNIELARSVVIDVL